jgi:hypothetical protein
MFTNRSLSFAVGRMPPGQRRCPGLTAILPTSWFDRDLADPTARPLLFVNEGLFFAPLIEYEVLPSLMVNVSKFFPPRAFMVSSPLAALKNEVRRIKILRRKPPT